MNKVAILFMLLLSTALLETTDHSVEGRWKTYLNDEESEFPTGSDIEGTESTTCKPFTPNFTCPTTPGWTSHVDDQGATCLWVSSAPQTFHSAKTMCQAFGGNLVSILSASRQETIKSLLSNQSSEQFWIGLIWGAYKGQFEWLATSQSVSYTNINYGYWNYVQWSENCGYLTRSQNGKWSITADCNSNYQFICEKNLECAGNAFGPRCDRHCHCYDQSCSEDMTVCQNGCQRGWMGKMCCNRKEKMDLVYYCVNSKFEDRYLLVRFDPKGVTYDVFRIVDVNGNPLECAYNDLIAGDASMKIRLTEHDDKPCAGYKSGNNTFGWFVKVREKFGVILPLDRNFEIQCDFDKADNFQRQAQKPLEKEMTGASYYHDPPAETPAAKREAIFLEFIDPASKDVLNQATLGSNVQLRMRLNISGNITAQGVSPFGCRASSPDGARSIELTDSKGCPMRLSPISAMKGSQGVLTSDPFELFTFAGHDEVKVSCYFTLCFTPEQLLCNDRCHELTAGKRKRRATEDGNKVTTATIHVLFAKVKQSPQPIHQHPLPLSLSVALVVVLSGGIFYLIIRHCSRHIHQQRISLHT